jgi:ABC-type Zn uptake system ZnuABC Zn-binding protein ZnuA
VHHKYHGRLVGRNISGEAFEVTALLDKGIDPHTYKPSKRDLDAIRAADVL